MDDAEASVSRVRATLARGWVQGALLAAVSLLAMLHYQFLPVVVNTPDGRAVHAASVGLPGSDGYYHIKAAYLYRTGEIQAAGADFHWTRESLWNGGFSDKDYLFHLYLIPFTLLADGPADADGLALAAKLGTAVLGMLLVLTLFVVIRAFGVPHAWVYALSIGVIGGIYFLFRLNLCRSYLMSVMFALTGWLLLARGQRLGLFLIAVVYTLAYTASHLLLALAILRAIGELIVGPRLHSTRLRDLRSNLVLMGCIAGGIAVGTLLHPQPLELVRLWWVQNALVLALSHRDTLAPLAETASAWLGMPVNLQPGAALPLGMELEPTDGKRLVFSSPVLFFSPLVLPLLAAVLGWRPSRETLLTSAVALVFFVAYIINTRFMEYAAPFMALAIALWLTGILSSDGYASWRERRPVAALALPTAGAVLALAGGAILWLAAAYTHRVPDRGEIEPAARWLHENEEAHGKLVWHDRWDDFTKLFFFASECDYLVGLDPTFFYLHNPERYRLWMEIQRGEHRDFLDTIRDEFEAQYILAHRSSSEFFYNRLHDYAQQGRLQLCIKHENDRWSLYRIAR
jgi:hypothetical protein